MGMAKLRVLCAAVALLCAAPPGHPGAVLPAGEGDGYGVKLCGREFIRAVIFTCGGSRWKRLSLLAAEPAADPSRHFRDFWKDDLRFRGKGTAGAGALFAGIIRKVFGQFGGTSGTAAGRGGAPTIKSDKTTLLPSLGRGGRSDAPWGAVGNACRYGFSAFPRLRNSSVGGMQWGSCRGFPPALEPWRRAARQSSRDVRERHGRGIARCSHSRGLLCIKELARWGARTLVRQILHKQQVTNYWEASTCNQFWILKWSSCREAAHFLDGRRLRTCIV